MLKVFTTLCFLAVSLPAMNSQGSNSKKPWHLQKSSHQMMTLSNAAVKILAQRQGKTTFESLLDPILIPRVVDTENHAKVRKYIINYLKDLDWHVATDRFNDTTPHGIKAFETIIATLDPKATRRLVLACHYDSKYSREETFIGATDSAVPCAMMMEMADVLDKELKAQRTEGSDVTLQLIFFDGEEAFRTWGPKDSIYGARHLAESWHKEAYPQDARGRSDGTNTLNRMDVLVLLDLLGVKNPRFYSFFTQTEHLYSRLVEIEKNLERMKLVLEPKSKRTYFNPSSTYAAVEDDHIPFMIRDVPILHIIPSPFPSVWHTYDDNKAALHFPTIENLNRIFRIFVAEYLHLTVNTSPK